VYSHDGPLGGVTPLSITETVAIEQKQLDFEEVYFLFICLMLRVIMQLWSHVSLDGEHFDVNFNVKSSTTRSHTTHESRGLALI
jgi:hypothetical protein